MVAALLYITFCCMGCCQQTFVDHILVHSIYVVRYQSSGRGGVLGMVYLRFEQFVTSLLANILQL